MNTQKKSLLIAALAIGAVGIIMKVRGSKVAGTNFTVDSTKTFKRSDYDIANFKAEARKIAQAYAKMQDAEISAMNTADHQEALLILDGIVNQFETKQIGMSEQQEARNWRNQVRNKLKTLGILELSERGLAPSRSIEDIEAEKTRAANAQAEFEKAKALLAQINAAKKDADNLESLKAQYKVSLENIYDQIKELAAEIGRNNNTIRSEEFIRPMGLNLKNQEQLLRGTVVAIRGLNAQTNNAQELFKEAKKTGKFSKEETKKNEEVINELMKGVVPGIALEYMAATLSRAKKIALSGELNNMTTFVPETLADNKKIRSYLDTSNENNVFYEGAFLFDTVMSALEPFTEETRNKDDVSNILEQFKITIDKTKDSRNKALKEEIATQMAGIITALSLDIMSIYPRMIDSKTKKPLLDATGYPTNGNIAYFKDKNNETAAETATRQELEKETISSLLGLLNLIYVKHDEGAWARFVARVNPFQGWYGKRVVEGGTLDRFTQAIEKIPFIAKSTKLTEKTGERGTLKDILDKAKKQCNEILTAYANATPIKYLPAGELPARKGREFPKKPLPVAPVPASPIPSAPPAEDVLPFAGDIGEETSIPPAPERPLMETEKATLQKLEALIDDPNISTSKDTRVKYITEALKAGQDEATIKANLSAEITAQWLDSQLNDDSVRDEFKENISTYQNLTALKYKDPSIKIDPEHKKIMDSVNQEIAKHLKSFNASWPDELKEAKSKVTTK